MVICIMHIVWPILETANNTQPFLFNSTTVCFTCNCVFPKYFVRACPLCFVLTFYGKVCTLLSVFLRNAAAQALCLCRFWTALPQKIWCQVKTVLLCVGRETLSYSIRSRATLIFMICSKQITIWRTTLLFVHPSQVFSGKGLSMLLISYWPHFQFRYQNQCGNT